MFTPLLPPRSTAKVTHSLYDKGCGLIFLIEVEMRTLPSNNYSESLLNSDRPTKPADTRASADTLVNDIIPIRQGQEVPA